jgi:hypothetical protein
MIETLGGQEGPRLPSPQEGTGAAPQPPAPGHVRPSPAAGQVPATELSIIRQRLAGQVGSRYPVSATEGASEVTEAAQAAPVPPEQPKRKERPEKPEEAGAVVQLLQRSSKTAGLPTPPNLERYDNGWLYLARLCQKELHSTPRREPPPAAQLVLGRVGGDPGTPATRHRCVPRATGHPTPVAPGRVVVCSDGCRQPVGWQRLAGICCSTQFSRQSGSRVGRRPCA